MEKSYIYLGEKWFEDLPKSSDEEKYNQVSQYRLMKYLFSDIVLSNTLCENLINEGYENCGMQELISPYDEETEEYCDEYQYFIVNLSLDEERTVNAIKRANTDLYLRYDENNDIYILSVGNCGMSREYIMTDIYFTDDIDKSNYSQPLN